MRRLIAPVVTVVLVASAAGFVPAQAEAEADASGSPSTVAGWSGTQPTPVGLAVSAGRLTAAFSTSEGSASTLWVADRPAGQGWAPATELADGVVGPSARFAENQAGAAVAGWDAADAGGGATMWVAVRPSATAAWSQPTAVVSDQLASHQPSVGIDSSGAVTVAYLHETSGAAAVVTRRLADASWSDPLQHSTAPAQQMLMRVAESGYVTLAWSQVESSDPTHAVLYGARYLAPTHTWAAPAQLGSSLPPTGLVDLAVNAHDLAALVTYFQPYEGRQVEIVRNRNGFPGRPCWPNCPNEWIFSPGGSDPVQAVSVSDSVAGQTFAASRREEVDGSHTIVTAQDNGSDFGRSSRVSATGDVDRPQIARSDGQPQYGDRVGVSWITHTADGDLLSVRGEWVPAYDDPVVDAGGTTLGRTTAASAMAVEPLGDIDVLWADAATGTLRLSTVSATRMSAPTRVFAQTTAVPVGWATTTPAGAGVRFDVRVRQATARRGFGAWDTTGSGATTSVGFRAGRGRTLCFATRVRPDGDRLSAWSRQRCTTTAVDDTSLTGRGWRTHRSRAYYGRSLRASSRRGASLSVARVRAKSLALLVSRRPGAGRVRVSFAGRTVATVSTAGRRGDTVVVPVADFARARRGRLTVTVVSRGKPVDLDGVFVSAAGTQVVS